MILTKEIEVSTGHRLPNHAGGCSSLHGHNYQITIKIEIADNFPVTNDQGFYIDFGDIKRTVNDMMDHKFLMYKDDPYLPIIQDLKGVAVVDFIPSAENIAIWLGKELYTRYNVNPKIKIYETSNSFVTVG